MFIFVLVIFTVMLCLSCVDSCGCHVLLAVMVYLWILIRYILVVLINISDVSLLCLPVGEGSCAEAGITVPTTVVVAEESESSEVVESTRLESWHWRGSEVPVLGELEDWKRKSVAESGDNVSGKTRSRLKYGYWWKYK